jgi:hypothetical protein
VRRRKTRLGRGHFIIAIAGSCELSAPLNKTISQVSQGREYRSAIGLRNGNDLDWVMKQVWSWSVMLCCACGYSQTNASLFSCRPLQLRELASEVSTSQLPFASAALQLADPRPDPDPQFLSFNHKTIVHAQPDVELDAFTGRTERQLYARLEQDGYFTRPRLQSENLIDRAVRSVFEPEAIRWGKTSVSCSLYTAIKRRNPFCLINPIFINISW